jgi:hypothetical protein
MLWIGAWRAGIQSLSRSHGRHGSWGKSITKNLVKTPVSNCNLKKYDGSEGLTWMMTASG